MTRDDSLGALPATPHSPREIAFDETVTRLVAIGR